MLRLGRHISVAGGIEMSFERAEALGCTAMQLFVTNPRSWAMGPMDQASVDRYSERSKASSVKDVIAHMPYLPNLSSSDKAIYAKSITSLKANLERCELLGIGHLVTHMGSHMGHGTEKGLDNISTAIDEVDGVALGVKILLENEAGHSNSVGADLVEMKKVYDKVGSKRLGFCLDTCHMFAMGYDIRDHKVLREIDSAIDLRNVHAIHLNDAKMELGSKRDRHANIGMGCIGLEGFRSFLSYGAMSSKILVLETPFDDKVDEKEEIASIRGVVK